jgi:hypothetical protein
MFPNVRLMIAAVLVTVAALSCGFGVFAAFRVSNEPLARLQAVATPLQLAADHETPSIVPLAARETFGVRYDLLQGQLVDRAAGLLALKVDFHHIVEPPSIVSVIGPGMGNTEPAQPAPLAQTAVPDGPQPAADAAAPEPSAPVASAPEPDSQQPGPAAQPAQTAAVETPADQAQPAEQTGQEAPPASPPAAAVPNAAATPDTGHHGIVRRSVSRQSIAVMTQRARTAPGGAIAQWTDQTSSFLQPRFQTAPAAPQPPSAKSRPSARTSAVGGPFVSPPTY